MFEFIDISSFSVRLKATIQKTGRLGFTFDTAQALDLANTKCVGFAREDKDSENLLLVTFKEQRQNALKVVKTGKYFYIPTKLMFDALGYDYNNKVIMFDLVRMECLDETAGGMVYKMNKRERIKRN